MQIFIPARIFKYSVLNELNENLKKLHITSKCVVFTNATILVKMQCENAEIKESINLDFYELKNLLRVGKRENGEISLHVNIESENNARIEFKKKNEIIRGIIKTYSNYLDYESIYKKFDEDVSAFNLSSDFSKIVLFDKANKIIEIDNNSIRARIGNMRIAKQAQATNINNSIALSLNHNSLLGIDMELGAKWYFNNTNPNSPYRVKQGIVDIVEMPMIL